ncbi:(5-formylfuran-3-yl)methyl phosphate synthase [Azospirillum halopraeferens]|uniref:(5-formylfuran-3-yl)methyl phosphate synthase n=1 Tax=Azospirillum halopraeferens TaxID=34010 RepID=UPI000A029C4C|nr:(5-formylfuran-3-yl)methyl phosphate synthase [Azospirillum halopraeferens]
MIGLLASVRDAAEARLAVAGGADIVDLKNPAAGALGALPPEVLRACVAAVAGRRPVSATVGDLPLDPARVAAAVDATAAMGVDIVKIGLFDGDLGGCLAALAPRTAAGLRLVAVLFADRRPDPDALDRLAAAGFVGAMLDTAGKTAGPLTRHRDAGFLRAFTARARRLGLMSGLAGSLRLADVAAAAAAGPDYLGFRGALCGDGGRAGALDPARLAAVRAAVQASNRATATAGAQCAAHSAWSAPTPSAPATST